MSYSKAPCPSSHPGTSNCPDTYSHLFLPVKQVSYTDMTSKTPQDTSSPPPRNIHVVFIHGPNNKKFRFWKVFAKSRLALQGFASGILIASYLQRFLSCSPIFQLQDHQKSFLIFLKHKPGPQFSFLRSSCFVGPWHASRSPRESTEITPMIQCRLYGGWF